MSTGGGVLNWGTQGCQCAWSEQEREQSRPEGALSLSAVRVKLESSAEDRKGIGFAVSTLTSQALCRPAKGTTWPVQLFVAGSILDMLVVRASALSDFSTEHKAAWLCW